MIVEDDALVALGIRCTLDELGYEVCGVAASEPEALALAGRTQPELALMDIRLAVRPTASTPPAGFGRNSGSGRSICRPIPIIRP